ncbi:YghX family hydrolase [Arachidicoccus ginsenosidivorans]|uniref:Dienelactone hydrolase family protein n=1 Tax=Arachidicoccus ginsenosidivorans TaxID=496057 RepID=A0A5B8VNX1_9BACT|nr:dienelactone hydrolase family protein [Arachidicoccus ginsenosidivorans]QEC72366.1 dienelactone hydrolase family protein [Arachidicoccus ginsenosidivorans]
MKDAKEEEQIAGQAPVQPPAIKQEVFDLYDQYAHNRITRKDFVQKLSLYAVGGLTVPALMSFLMPDYKNSVEVGPDDPRIMSEYVYYDSPNGGGRIKALLCQPKSAKGKLGGVVVVHENRGLNPYIEEVARKLALEGFISLAPDALTPLGGYPGNDDEGRSLQTQRTTASMLEDFITAYYYLRDQKSCNGKVGVVGFCFGGGIANLMAVKIPTLAAAVPFYGGQPPEDEVKQIQAPLLIQYAGLDTRVNAGWPAYEAALKENHKKYQVYIYPDVNHGFHNNTTPRFNRAAADLAWKRTIDFLGLYTK